MVPSAILLSRRSTNARPVDKASKQRWTILLAALGATIVAAVAPVEEPPPDIVGTASESTRSSNMARAGSISGSPVETRSLADFTGSDPFAVRSWVGTPSAVAIVSAAPVELAKPTPVPIFDMPQPPPAAPPLPYRFAGRLTDGAEQTFYLSRGDQLMVAKNGDTLESAYRIIGVDDRRIQFQHLATGEIQALNLPSAEN